MKPNPGGGTKVRNHQPNNNKIPIGESHRYDAHPLKMKRTRHYDQSALLDRQGCRTPGYIACRPGRSFRTIILLILLAQSTNWTITDEADRAHSIYLI